jgi:uncharacterized protein (DUF1778 family)
MSVLRSRRHMITFRLCSEEYEALKQACAAQGFRSFSDFARTAVLHKTTLNNAHSRLLGEDLSTLSLALNELHADLEQLSKRIEHVLGPAAQQARANS